jgi:hypothetical protein
MRANRVQKTTILILIFGQLALWPFSAFAVPLPLASVVAPLTAIPVSPGGTAAGNLAFNTAMAGVQGLYDTCNDILKGFEQTDQGVTMGMSFASLLSGGGALAGQYGAEADAYDLFTTCLDGSDGIEGVIGDLDAVPAPDSYTSGIKAQFRATVVAKYNAYVLKYNSAAAKYNVASQGVWKALLITILINTTKTVADALVNHLVSNYKITNIKAYTDSIATLMYDNQFLRDNFPATQDQMMARQILLNPLLRSQIQPGIYQAATNFVNPTKINYNSPNFYNQMAMAGSSPGNPYFIQTAMVSGVDQSHSSALATAQTTISQGSGYKAPVNCAGSLQQQQLIDTQTKQAQALLANRQQLLTNLQQNGGSASDIAKAQADVNAANTAWQSLPYTVTGQGSVSNSAAGGGNNTEGSAAIVMCEAINSPAILVNQGIDAVFKSLNLGQYNNSNLPQSLAAISTMATQIGSSLILGGTLGSGGTNASLLNEQKAINSAASIAGSAVFPPTTLNQAGASSGIIFNTPLPSYSNGTVSGYNLTWQILPTVSGASYVGISGPGLGLTKQPLTGGFAVPSYNAGESYTLTVYSATGASLGTATVTVPQPPTNSGTNGGLTYNSSAPTVAGAYTDKPVLNIRGPAVVVTPRD